MNTLPSFDELFKDWTDIEAVHYLLAISFGLISIDGDLANESVSWKRILNTRNPIMDFVQVVCRWMIKQGYFEEDAEAGMLIWRGGSGTLLEECNLFRGPKGPVPYPLRE